MYPSIAHFSEMDRVFVFIEQNLRGVQNVSVNGGYTTLRVGQIALVINSLNEKKISLRSVRIYLAAVLSANARNAAFALQSKIGKRARGNVRYSTVELARLTGLALSATKREVRILEAAKLLTFSESQLFFHEGDQSEAFGWGSRHIVPISRRLLRYLCRSERAAELKTILAYCVRGLSLKRTGEVKSAGTVKAVWIAENFGLSVRSVRSERLRLIEAGLITKDIGSKQWKLNRDGAYFVLNTAWQPVEKSSRRPPKIAPLGLKNRPCFAPPCKDKISSFRTKDQKTQRTEPTGVSMKQEEKGRCLLPPTIKNVQAIDLESFFRAKTLFNQARKLGLVQSSQAAELNWFAAAVRAKSAKTGDPVKIFMGIVRQGLWHHITQQEEDRALVAMKKYGGDNR